MKKIFILLVLAAMSFTSAAQVYQVNGKTISVVPEASVSSSNDIQTSWTFEDKEGTQYDIWLHQYPKGEKAGEYVAYVNKVSKKTGNPYKSYLKLDNTTLDIIVKEYVKK